MAEDKANAVEQTGEAEAPKKKAVNLKSLIMIGGWVLGQAVIVLVVLWFARSTQETPVTALAEAAGQPDMVEVPIVPNDPDAKIKAINAKSGRLVYWMLKVHLQVPKAQSDYVTERLKDNENFVKQEISTIVSACDPMLLEQEADHATLKRQIRFSLNKVLGKGTVNDVLISECIPATLE